MSRGVFRIVAKPVEDEWRDAEIVIDLLLNDDHNIVADRPYCGFQGPAKHAAPFILQRDGRLDFGRDLDDFYRYYDSNIIERKIMLGNYFTIDMLDMNDNKHKEATFTIKDIIRY